MPSSASPQWLPLPLDPPPRDETVLSEILDGGQAFRWHRQSDGTWLGTWADYVVNLRASDGKIEYRTAGDMAHGFAAAVGRYFALDRDYPAIVDATPWRTDAHLARCIEQFRGLRILRQPFGETLLAFLCSATKQIVQIKQMLALLARRHGQPVSPFNDPRDGGVAPPASAFNVQISAFSVPGSTTPATSLNSQLSALNYTLPTWPELAAVPESELRACLLGFRASYIHKTAQFLHAHPGWLEETESLSYPAAKERLCSLPGVGEKVADCVLLFGAGRLEAFPVDVWILKAMAARYGLHGWKPAQVAQFGRAHFGPLAGLAQQYLFAFERRASRRM